MTKPIVQYQYLYETWNDAQKLSFTDYLNTRGLDGWQLVNWHYNGAQIICVFLQPL